MGHYPVHLDVDLNGPHHKYQEIRNSNTEVALHLRSHVKGNQ